MFFFRIRIAILHGLEELLVADGVRLTIDEREGIFVWRTVIPDDGDAACCFDVLRDVAIPVLAIRLILFVLRRLINRAVFTNEERDSISSSMRPCCLPCAMQAPCRQP